MRLSNNDNVPYADSLNGGGIIGQRDDVYEAEVIKTLKSICKISEQSYDDFVANFTYLHKEDIELNNQKYNKKLLNSNELPVSNRGIRSLRDSFSAQIEGMECQTSKKVISTENLFEEEIILEENKCHEKECTQEKRKNSLQVDNFLLDESSYDLENDIPISDYKPSSYSTSDMPIRRTDCVSFINNSESMSLEIDSSKVDISSRISEIESNAGDDYLDLKFSKFESTEVIHEESDVSLNLNEMIFPGETLYKDSDMIPSICKISDTYLDSKCYSYETAIITDEKSILDLKFSDHEKPHEEIVDMVNKDSVVPFSVDEDHDYEYFIASSKFSNDDEKYLAKINAKIQS